MRTAQMLSVLAALLGGCTNARDKGSGDSEDGNISALRAPGKSEAPPESGAQIAPAVLWNDLGFSTPPEAPAKTVATMPRAESPVITPVAQNKPSAASTPESVPAAIVAESPVINWFNELSDAKAAAAVSGKDIAVVFMGDETNSWCRQLESAVLSRPAFALNANKNFVFLLVDFPTSYSLPAKQAERNAALRDDWGVRAFPTVVLADAAGRPYAVTGFRNLGAADYAAEMSDLRRIRERRDFYFASAQTEIGTGRAMFLAQGLRVMDGEIVLRHYAAEFDELKHLDPENGTGLVGDIEFMPKLDALRSRVIVKVRGNRDYAGALKVVDDFIERESPTGEHLQRVLFLKLNVYGSAEKRDHAAVVELMNAIIEIDPLSDQGVTAAEVRARAQALLAGPNAVPAQ